VLLGGNQDFDLICRGRKMSGYPAGHQIAAVGLSLAAMDHYTTIDVCKVLNLLAF
jgi:hypothetical protein